MPSFAKISQDQPRPKPRFYQSAYGRIALCLLLVGAMAVWQRKLQAQDAALQAQLSALKVRWDTVSKQLHEATDARPRLLGMLSGQKRIVQQRSASGWAQVLRGVVAVVGRDIELQDIHARKMPKEPGVGELRICGVAIGESPRSSADQFRVALEAKLGKDLVGNAVLTEFAPCDNGPEEPPNGVASRRAAFTIVIAIGLADRAAHGPENL